MEQTSRKAVIYALIANLGIAIFKIFAALLSRSSSMLAEGYHSISDTLNQVLLLLGLKRCQKAACRLHPFGHGKEQFFWSFVVAIILFGIAGTLSIREGLHRYQHPEPISHVWLTYLAIGVAIVFETFALRIAVQQLKKEIKEEKHKNWIEGLKNSKDPVILTVLFEDSLALLGLFIAGLAITLVQLTGILVIDAIASIIIGVLLMVFALFLANETRKLLVGEAVTPYKRRRILNILAEFDEINTVVSLKTMHLSAEEVLVAVELNYRDEMKSDDIEAVNDRIEAKIREIIPHSKIYLEPESLKDS
ncbi:cation diffusion facilitator family transporter [Acidobacteriota bacterium]